MTASGHATGRLGMVIATAGLFASLGVSPSGPLFGQQAVERALQQRSNARSVQELQVDQSMGRQPEAPAAEPRPSLGPRLRGRPTADRGTTLESPGADRFREERLDQRQLQTRQLREAGGRRQVGRAAGSLDGPGERSARSQRFERQQRQQQLNRRINRPRR